MLIITHFSVPFYSYFITSRCLNNSSDQNSVLLNSTIVGIVGLLPDLLNVHVTLSARHNSFSHTIWLPILIFFVYSIPCVIKETLPRRFIFWFPFAVLLHLFLDIVSGGVRFFYPSPSIIGKYLIPPHMWVLLDVFFLSLIVVTYKSCYKKTLAKSTRESL